MSFNPFYGPGCNFPQPYLDQCCPPPCGPPPCGPPPCFQPCPPYPPLIKCRPNCLPGPIPGPKGPSIAWDIIQSPVTGTSAYTSTGGFWVDIYTHNLSQSTAVTNVVYNSPSGLAVTVNTNNVAINVSSINGVVDVQYLSGGNLLLAKYPVQSVINTNGYPPGLFTQNFLGVPDLVALGSGVATISIWFSSSC